jgi:type IV pilus assembly protein PilV
MSLPAVMKHSGQRSCESGFTLIEVLVSLIVLVVGILGSASMQVSTYKQLQSSNNMASASMLAGEFADRMRANANQVLAGAYNHTAAPRGTEARNCAALICTAAQIAAYDIAQWQLRVKSNAASGTRKPGSLPSGSAAVARVGTSRDFTITLRWDDDRSGSTSTDCDALDPDAGQGPDDLDCQVVMIRI